MSFPPDWDLPVSHVYMGPETYREIVVCGLMEDGWTEEAANAEVDRRFEVMNSDTE